MTPIPQDSMNTLPIVDLDVFLADPDGPEARREAENAADALKRYGALVVKDSRVAEADNEQFLDLMEDYFDSSEEGLKLDERPEVGYQVGVTLENTEKPKCKSDEACLNIIKRLDPSERPLDVEGHFADPKCRFFWKMQERPPYDSKFPALNMPNVTPKRFAEIWEDRLEMWGKSMKTAVEGVAEMAAMGFGLDRSTFREAGKYGPHLLAPTASDLRKWGKLNIILAGFHTDLNFLTIHGRSRYPGLHVWARNTGKKIAVKVPPGRYLLVQAGKQLEHLTGGLVKAGFHEVVVTEATIKAVEKYKLERPNRPLIRISSTFFWHLSSDLELAPIKNLQSAAVVEPEEEPTEYPPVLVGQQVQNELKHIALMA